MNSTKKKICMLGGFAVGKTSLVQRFVNSMFSEDYMTTVGVKIDQKSIQLTDGTTVELVLWDIHGDDDFQSVRDMYLRGMSGYLLVADGTSRSTLTKATRMHDLAGSSVGDVPFILLLNKRDLEAEWEITRNDIAELQSSGWRVIKTSAKTGENVEEAFTELAEMMIA